MVIQGKVFIVTGGASGLGEGTARMLVAHGGQVVIADMQVEKGEAIAKELGGAFVRCDVSNEADGQAVVAERFVNRVADTGERGISRFEIGVLAVHRGVFDNALGLG